MGYSSGRYNSSLNTPPALSALFPYFLYLESMKTHPHMEMTRVQIPRRRNDGDSPHLVQPRFRVGSRTLDARSPVCVVYAHRNSNVCS
jgi:hypothetical protein